MYLWFGYENIFFIPLRPLMSCKYFSACALCSNKLWFTNLTKKHEKVLSFFGCSGLFSC